MPPTRIRKTEENDNRSAVRGTTAMEKRILIEASAPVPDENSISGGPITRPRVQDNIVRRILSGHGNLNYLLTVMIVLASNLLWYNFSLPPIGANVGFSIYPVRSIFNSLYLINIYSWPGDYIPPVFGLPNDILYGIGYLLSNGNYGIAYFVSNVVWEILGGLSLYYLSSVFGRRYGVPKHYSLFAVVFFSFNVQIIMGVLFNLWTAMLLILIALVFLSLYRSNYYSLILGLYSFFLLGSFPAGTLIFSVEAAFVFLIMYGLGLAKSIQAKEARQLRRLTKSLVLSVGCFVLGSAYLWLPFLYVSELYTSALTDPNPSYPFDFSFNKIQTLPNALRLINNWAVVYPQYAQPWMPAYLMHPVVQSLLYLVPIMSLASILFLKSRTQIATYCLMLGTIFLSKANNPPFGEPFVWLISNIPLSRGFYNGASFSPALISLYSIFSVLTLYNVNIALAAFVRKHTKPEFSIHWSRALPAVLPILIVIMLLVSVYPVLSPMLTTGPPTNPLVSSLPSYYVSASEYLHSSGPFDPVMVFPSVNVFNSNRFNNVTWYSGVNIYSAIIENPSVSGIFPLNYVGGKRNAYEILNHVYGIEDRTFLSDDNYADLPNYAANSSVIGWIPYLGNDTVTWLSSSGRNVMEYLVDSSIYHDGGHWLIGSLGQSLNLTVYKYAIIQYGVVNMNPLYLWLGIFQDNGAGQWYRLSDYPTLQSDDFNTTALTLDSPTFNGGASLDRISALVISYDPPASLGSSNQILIHGLKFYTGGNDTSKILARNLDVLGVRYAYVDTSITSSPNPAHVGDYYNRIFGNSMNFKLLFHEGPLYIYENLLYSGLFSAVNSAAYYYNDGDLFGKLYYSFSPPAESFVAAGTDLGSGFGNNSTVNYRIISPTEYIVNAKADGSFLLVFKMTFSEDWVAVTEDGHTLERHFEVNGFANGWVVPENVTKIKILFQQQIAYHYVELILVSLPFAMGLLILVLRCRLTRPRSGGR